MYPAFNHLFRMINKHIDFIIYLFPKRQSILLACKPLEVRIRSAQIWPGFGWCQPPVNDVELHERCNTLYQRCLLRDLLICFGYACRYDFDQSVRLLRFQLPPLSPDVSDVALRRETASPASASLPLWLREGLKTAPR